MTASRRRLPLLPALVAAPLLALALPGAAIACDDPTGLCVESGAVKWKSDATVSASQKRKERSLAKKSAASLTLTIAGEESRGTVFIDGRFAGIAPLSSFSLPPGSHEIQIRDGNRILAEGVLSFPAGESATVEIRY